MKKINKTSKKKILGVLALGGLALSTPFMAFATTTNDDTINEDNKIGKGMPIKQLDNEEHLEFIQKKLDMQIEHANTLIDALDDEDDVDTDRLKEIVEEFAELEATLDELDINDSTKDEMREVFFEFREDARELSQEFKELITDAFSEEEKESFREEFDTDKEELREEYDLPIREEGEHKNHRGPKFTTEQIEQIDSNIAEDLANEDITMKEAMEEIKEILESMSDEDREEFMEELGIEKPENNHRRNGMGLMGKN